MIKSTSNTAYITHPACLKHDNGMGHPESPERLLAIQQQLQNSGLYQKLKHFEAPEVTREQLERVHNSEYLDNIEQHAPLSEQSVFYLDPDTRLSHGSLEAARRAAGAIVLATDLVMTQEVNNAFCAVRPPGHHAKSDQAMGFCIYNNITVGIAHAIEHHGLQRVALLDFDVHHGNGSENILRHNERVLFCSTFQHPYYPNEPFAQDNPQVICSPLRAGSSGTEFRTIVEDKWLTALQQFKPQMIFISAGFDAHRDDFLANLNFTEADYQWATEQIVTVAGQFSQGRIVSSLEGGYHTTALARSVESHLMALMDH
ncbi:MAG: histone deacetylase family protein [Gammaproteobacteria bacterium]|nr:histone deacetylase family protein [Gammaproteobacteria bacterium]